MVKLTQEIFTNLKKITDYIEIPLVTTCIGISFLSTTIFNVTIFIQWEFGLENTPLYVSEMIDFTGAFLQMRPQRASRVTTGYV